MPAPPSTAATGGAATRDEIVAVSGRLFATHGIEGTTMRAIAAACGIKASSLYNHFASKDAIVAEVMSRSATLAEALFDEVRSPELEPTERLEALMRATVSSFRAHPEASRMFFENPEYVASAPELHDVRASARAIDELWESAIADAAAAGVLRDGVDPSTLWPILHRMMLAAAQQSAPAHPAIDLEGVTTILLNGIVRGSSEPSAEQ
jgi:AcrR family transcriptional regulator